MRQPEPPPQPINALARLELVLIAAMAVLLPFDHWFFGHIINPAPMRVIGFALCAVWLLQIVLRQRGFRPALWHATAVIFIGVCLFSTLYSPPIPNPHINNLQYKLVATIKIAATLVFLALACEALDTKKITLFLRVHVVTGIVVCVTSLILYALHMAGLYSHGFALWVDKDIYNFVRIQGVSPEPHRFGAYTLTLIPWLMLPRARAMLGVQRRVALPAVGLIFLSLMLSYSVAAFVALPLLLILLTIQSKEALRATLRILLAVVIVLAIAAQVPAIQRGTQEIIDVKMRGHSFEARKYQWTIAVIETLAFPWTGVGPESYSYFIGTIDAKKKHATPASNPPQSMLFGIMANTGYPGLISFLAFMIVFLAGYFWRYAKATEERTLAHAAMAIALSHFVYQQSIWLPWSLNQWLFMAMAWAALGYRSTTSALRTNAHT